MATSAQPPLSDPVHFGDAGASPVHELVLRTSGGAEARVLTYGAVIRDLQVPHPDGGRTRVVLGHDSLDAYLADRNYVGAVVGRFANRIAHGRFMLDGREWQLDRNEGDTTLHGGRLGFSTRVWSVVLRNADSVTLRLDSADGDQGFPGRLLATCRYTLSDRRGLVVELGARTDRPTPVSLAQHSYFSLGARDVRPFRLTVEAGQFTPVDGDLIPTGDIADVSGTPFDFRQGRSVGSVPGGLDHNFVPPPPDRGRIRPVASVRNPANGLQLEVFSTQPGLQVYDGAKFDPAGAGLGAESYGPYAGLCLETQALPDAPNQPAFPDAILRPGDVYRHVTEYRFDWTPV